jgi:hypothetical protein
MSMRKAFASVLPVLGLLFAALPAQAEEPGDLLWVRQGAGELPGAATAVVTFPDGSSVVTGSFQEVITFGAGEPNETTVLSETYGASVFVARYFADGSLAWARGTAVSSPPYAEANSTAAAALPDGSCVVTGAFVGSVTFGPGEPNETTLMNDQTAGFGYDVFVARYAADGTLVWAKQAGGSGATVEGYGTSSFGDGSCVVTGGLHGRVTFGEGEPNETTLDTWGGGGPAAFVARYGADGSLVWAKCSTGAYAEARSADAFPDGSCLVAGRFSWSVTFGQGEPNETTLDLPSNWGLFAARFGADGSLVWARCAAAADSWGNPSANAAAVFLDGSYVLTGYFNGTVTFGEGDANETTLAVTQTEIFVARYGADGSLAWAKRAGATTVPYDCEAHAYGVAALRDGSCVVVGSFTFAITFAPGEPDEVTFAAAATGGAFVARYGPDGSLAWARAVGLARAFAADTFTDGSCAVAGAFYGTATFGEGEPNETVLVSSGVLFEFGDAFVALFAGEGQALVLAGSDVTVTPQAVLPEGSEAPVRISFEQVDQGGVATVTASEAGPTPPSGFRLGRPPIYYEVTTTAQFTGEVIVCFTWEEGQIRNERNLRLFHQEGGRWVDVTISKDTDANIICGRVTSFSEFILAEVVYDFSGVLRPIRADGSSVFKAGRAIPVMFTLRGPDGGFVRDATATLRAFRVVDGTPEEVPVKPVRRGECGGDDDDDDDGGWWVTPEGNEFGRIGRRYFYGLSTKGYACGNYLLEISLDDGSTHEAMFSLR